MKKVALSLLLTVGVLFGDNISKAESYFQIGMSYDELKDYTSAIKSYTKVIELNPNILEAYYNRGLAHSDLKEYDLAIKDYTVIIESNPNILEAYINRGWAYGLSGDYKSAMRDARTACRLGDCGVVQDMAQRGWMTE